MRKIILYHGSPEKAVTPKFGLGEEKGFILRKVWNLRKSGLSAVLNSEN